MKMFDYLVADNELISEFEKYNLSDLDRTFITEQIRGPSKDMKGKVNKDCIKYEWYIDKFHGLVLLVKIDIFHISSYLFF